ncbi:circadian clock-controlled protein daywake [Halyomorpha halys]|uniref:circadian clock-controlled protein daywake n=1 Tax=Halyomorpha halys TaxID=286706 RepID=UPI0006D51AA0|nr:uncharacterized protein LOC106690166 [Halyomorpha halys]
MEHIWTLIIFSAALAHSTHLPDYVEVCKRTDPNLQTCIQKSIENLRPRLIEGMPEMKVPPIEPLIIDEPIANEGTGLKVVTKNLKAWGGSNYTLKNLDIDPLKPKFNFHLNIPHLKVEGVFDVDGKIIMIPVKGNGEITADVYDVDSEVSMKSELVNKDGDQFLSFYGLDLNKLKIGKGKIHIDNMFGRDDKLIGDVISSAINLNFNYFVQELKPTIVSTLTQFAVKSANNIVRDVPLSELFPE